MKNYLSMKTLTDFCKTAETGVVRAWHYSSLDLKVIGFVFNITLGLGFLDKYDESGLLI